MENFSTILQTVWRPAQKNYGRGLHQPPLHGRGFPRPARGAFERLLSFFEDSEHKAVRRVFTHLIPHVFCNFCENFDQMSCKVRSPGQVKWPNYKITFQSRHGYNVSGKLWNFRNMMRSSVPTKRISRIFDIGDLRSGHFCDHPIICQWAKNQLRYIYFGASLFESNHIV